MAKSSASPLTEMQQRFVEEYPVDLNGRQAAIRAGCPEKSAAVTASKWLTKANVRDGIDARLQQRAAKVEVKADDVLRELKTFGHLDPAELFDENGALLPLKKMPEHVRRAIASFEVEEITDHEGMVIGQLKKVKLWNKKDGLELLGKHISLFNDRPPGPSTTVNIALTVNLDYARLTVDELRQLDALISKATPALPG